MKKPKGSLISYFSRKVAKGGGINLAQGKPGFAPPTELLSILKEKIADKSLHQYAPGNGNFDLLELLAGRGAGSSHNNISTDNLLIVQGATEGIFLSFLYLTRILEKPFSVLSFDPVYESYPRLPEIFFIPFEYFDLQADLSVDFDNLEKTIVEKKVKIIFIASPGNPLGKVWTRREIEKLVLLSKKYGFYIVFDAVYKDIYFEKPPFNPLTLDYEKLFYVDSFSKMLSITGWRIGYLISGAEDMVRIRDIHDYTGLSAVPLFQAAIFEYLDRHDFGREYIEAVRTKCGNAYRFMREALAELGFTVADSQGGYFLWARLPEKYNDAFRFAMDLYDAVKVAVVPGENFSPRKKDCIRINIALEMAVIEEAARRIKNFFENV
ncbi:MAG: pyridoxal phosphate-dependent aminotransferase [Candidatus Aminicenantes bacterium]|nr:pyridoxal phosphate-dependent aminotransferase [Candidatus Aminicenantes bacterium]